MRYVFGFIIYGVTSPWNQVTATTCLYTNGKLPSTGLPAELTGAEVRTIVARLPGSNFGADPRAPVGAGQEATVTLHDEDGTLGTLFLHDPDANYWGLETNRLEAADILVALVNLPSPIEAAPLYLGNECVEANFIDTPTQYGTLNVQLTRGLCGSTARAHILSPSEYSPDEDGSQDRLWLTSKPNWDNGFYCGVYLFQLAQDGSIADYVLRRGVVVGEPTPIPGKLYEVKVRFLEDELSEHTIGETSKETALGYRVIVTELRRGRATRASILMSAEQASQFFNEPVGPRGTSIIDSATLADLSSRLTQDANIYWSTKLTINGDEWIYKINGLSIYSYTNNGVSHKAVKLSCSLLPGGYAPGATIIEEGTASTAGGGQTTTYAFKPWWKNAVAGTFFESGAAEGDNPTVTLRVTLTKRVAQAFLILACSRDGSSGGTYDKLIGQVGAGMPEAFFNIGTVAGSALGIAGNTAEILRIDQLLQPINTYTFDLSKGINLKEFLANEFIASQLLLGSLQNGKLSLKSWVHEVASLVTLAPLNTPVGPGTRLSPVKRLDLSAGVRILDLEPVVRRKVRFLGATKIKDGETQAIRFWRNGLNLSVTEISSGDLAQLVRVFYRIMGGRPVVYEVPVAIEDYLADGLEIGDACAWSDTSIPTPSGLGISGDFFIVGVDLNYDEGVATYKLLKNTLVHASVPVQEGLVAPAIKTPWVAPVSSTTVKVAIETLNGANIVADSDYNGWLSEVLNNGGHIKIQNVAQAPIGDKERLGSIEAVASITNYATVDGKTILDLTIDSAYLRGDITQAADLFDPETTRILAPERQPATTNLLGSIVEADQSISLASVGYVQIQPRTALNEALYTTRT
jgi:hypothetical protein